MDVRIASQHPREGSRRQWPSALCKLLFTGLTACVLEIGPPECTAVGLRGTFDAIRVIARVPVISVYLVTYYHHVFRLNYVSIVLVAYTLQSITDCVA